MVKQFALAASILLASCGSSTVTTSVRGADVTVNLSQGQAIDAELLAVMDDAVIAMGDTVIVLSQKDVKSIVVQVSKERGWMYLVGATELPVSILLLGASPAIGLIGLAVCAGTVISFIVTEPQSTFTWPITQKELEELRLHARFPYGVTNSQLDQIRALGKSQPTH